MAFHDPVERARGVVVHLAGPGLFDEIDRLVLRGVPSKYVEKPPFQHTFGPEVDFYQLQFGEEWSHVIREGSLALYIHPVLEKANVFLYWR